MTTDEIQKKVTNFVLNHIDSIEKLEVLLFLHKNAGSSWTPKEITEQIRTNETSVSGRLQSLEQIDLVKSEDNNGVLTFQYNRDAGEICAIVDKVAKFYQEKRVSLIELVFSKSSEKVLSFAEAFRFRKDDKK